MEPIQEATKCYDQMFIVEKYEKVISYLYPIAQSIPRQHGVARDKFLSAWTGHAQWADSHNLISWMENHYGITCH